MNLRTASVGDYPLETAMQMMNRAFDGYLAGSITFAFPDFLTFIAREGVDLRLSQLVLKDDAPVGVGFVSQSGWRSHLSGMGVIPEAKGQGIGSWFMAQLIDQAKGRGDKLYELECFEQNHAALPVYYKNGFEVVRRLYGYQHETGIAPQADEALIASDVESIARQIMNHGYANLPWQMDAADMLRQSPPSIVYTLEDAYALVRIAGETLVLMNLITPQECRREGRASRLLRAIAAKHPDVNYWRVPAIFPQEMDDFFAHHGFIRDDLNQFQMTARL